MSAIAAPYGLKPLNLIGGLPYAGSTREIPIASGYNTNIFYGSVVNIVTSGTLTLVTTIGTVGSAFPAGTIGVFLGCSYTGTDGQKKYAQYWPANQVATDAVGFVVDDDRCVFQAQCAGSMAQSALGANIGLNAVQSTYTGSTLFGNSNVALSAAPLTTAEAFRIVGFVNAPGSAVGDAFTDVLVKFNGSQHSYGNSTGI